MKQKYGSFLRALPILYTLVILILLFIHFTRFEEMSLVINNISYKGTRTAGSAFSPSKISRLAVYTNGLEMDFTHRNSLKIITGDGIVRNLEVKSIENTGNGIILHFKYDVNIKVESTPQTTNSTIEISVPQTIPPITEIKIKARAQKNYILSLDEKERLSFSDGTSTFFMNSRAVMDFQNSILSITMAGRVSSIITLEDEAPGLGRSVREWLADSDKTVPPENAAITQFSNKAYSGWKARFDKNTGNWTMPDSPPEFSEILLVQYLSESFRRGDQSLVASDLLKAAEKNSGSLSWYSSPFTGDIVNKTAPLLRGGPENLLEAKTALKLSANPDVSPYKEILELKKILDDPGRKDTVPWIEENIYPLIVWLEEGLYILHPENPETDTLFSLKAAQLLKEAGQRTGDEDLLSISSKLRATILNRADKEGILPGKISFSRERPSLPSGAVVPEEVFGLYQKPEYSPRIIDLSDKLGKGSWLYTTVESATVAKTNQDLVLKFRFPRGQIHHFVLKGVEPFDKVYLHNIRWKSDPRFQKYSDGWVYDSVNKVLYVKIKHRVTNETIRIQFTPPDPPTTKEQSTVGQMVQNQTAPPASGEESPSNSAE